MKCKKCGANIKEEDVICPYCGSDNEFGKYKKKYLDSYKKENDELSEEIAKKDKKRIRYKTHVYINLGLAFIAIFIGTISVIIHMENNKVKNVKDTSVKAIKEYYENEDYLSLYLAMEQTNGYNNDKIDDDIKYVAGIYGEYRDMRRETSLLIQGMDLNDGTSPLSALTRAFSIYESENNIYKLKPSENAIERTADMRDEAYAILVNMFCIPPEKLEELKNVEGKEYWDMREELEEYATEVINSEYNN